MPLVQLYADLHKTQITIHVRSGDKIEALSEIKQYLIASSGYAELLARIAEYEACGYEVKIGLESAGNTRFFKNQVEKAGTEVSVINTLKLRKRSFRRKTLCVFP